MQHLTATPLVSIVGPTGVGKSACAASLAAHVSSGMIINGDMGQLYTPLSCGTAKPDWKHASIPHVLFDVLDEPQDFSALSYRALVEQELARCALRKNIAFVVGGSLFYQKTLFFRPQGPQSPPTQPPFEFEKSSSWQLLFEKDPVRAQELHPHDQYRIQRALAIAHSQTPSHCKPMYSPLSNTVFFIHITRDREDLYHRINMRVDEMLHAGWMEEVASLSPQWHAWLKRKKLIGYDELIATLESGALYPSLACRERIKQRTRNYAKRQLSLWTSYREALERVLPDSTCEINLTSHSFDLYLGVLTERMRLRGILCAY